IRERWAKDAHLVEIPVSLLHIIHVHHRLDEAHVTEAWRQTEVDSPRLLKRRRGGLLRAKRHYTRLKARIVGGQHRKVLPGERLVLIAAEDDLDALEQRGLAEVELQIFQLTEVRLRVPHRRLIAIHRGAG